MIHNKQLLDILAERLAETRAIRYIVRGILWPVLCYFGYHEPGYFPHYDKCIRCRKDIKVI
jgi:hypothetical protein